MNLIEPIKIDEKFNNVQLEWSSKFKNIGYLLNEIEKSKITQEINEKKEEKIKKKKLIKVIKILHISYLFF